VTTMAICVCLVYVLLGVLYLTDKLLYNYTVIRYTRGPSNILYRTRKTQLLSIMATSNAADMLVTSRS
jgi:hypothetical protein